MDVWKHFRAILLLPSVVIVVIPATVLALTGLDTFDLWQSAPAIRVVLLVLGCAFIYLGLVLMVTTIRLFVTVGKGTLAPWNPTQRLVVQGVYRYVRNPMISGGLFILLGESLLAASLPILVLFVVFLVVNDIYIPLFEEPGLSRRFADEYLTYKQNVPRWIPRLTAWEAAPMDMRFGVTKATRSQYEAFLQERSAVLNDCLQFLDEACKKVGDAYRAGGITELALIALARHVVECLDGVSVLVARGSVLPCYPLLRSIFDASLGVMYILQGDSANRAAAYFVVQIRQEMAFLERCDPTTNSGAEIRRELQNDIAGPTALDGLSMQEAQKHLATLQADLDDAILKNADQTWITKNKKNAEWYSLFGGPENLRDLAKALSYLSGYELHYRPWCRQVYATDTLKSLSEHADSIGIRPIRCPDGIHDVLRSAGIFAITLAARLYGKYDPENSFVPRYRELEERTKTLASVKAPAWDGQFE